MRRMTSPLNPRLTPSGYTRTRERSMASTLASGVGSAPAGRPTAYDVRDLGRHRVVGVGLDGAGTLVQRDDPGPDARLDVGVVVLGTAGAHLHRRLGQGYGEQAGRGELLAGVGAQGLGTPR